MTEEGSDARLKKLGGMEWVEKRLATEEERLQIEQADVERKTPADNEPGEDLPERPPAGKDAIQ